MGELIRELFSKDFMPHGTCYLWRPGVLWLNVISDLAIAAAYYAIPVILVRFWRQRRDLAFNWVFLAFAAFILACGTTHLIEVLTVWKAYYALAGAFKALTALVSVATAIALVPLVSVLIALPSPSQLAAMNKALASEIEQRKAAEAALLRSNNELELRVAQRTAELEQKNRELKAAHHRLEALIDTTPLAIFEVDLDGRVLAWSVGAERTFGFSRDDVLHRLPRFVPEESLDEYQTAMRETLAGRTISDLERRRRKKDGATIDVAIWASPLYDDAGVVRGAVCVAADNTGRKRAEERLRESEARLAAIIDSAMVGVVTADEQQRITLFNPAAEEMFGYSAADVLGRPLGMLIPQRFRSTHTEHIGAFQQGDVTHRKRGELGNVYGLRADSVEFPIEASISKVEVAGQTTFTAILRDITDRKEAEDHLLEERDFSNALVDSLPGVMYLFDAQGRFLRWNKNLEKITGYSADEISRMPPIDFFRGEDCELIAERIGEVFVQGQSTAEAEFVFKDGSHRPYFFTGLRVGLPQGQCLVGMGVDITERKRAEQAIRESQQLLRAVIDNSTACVYVKDLKGCYFLVNRRFEELFHVTLDTLRGKTDHEVFPKEQADAFRAFDQQVLAAGTVLEAEELAPHDDGMHTYLSIKCPLHDAEGRPYAVCGISTDITERKRAEAEIRQLNMELEKRIRERTTQLEAANASMHQLTGQLLRLQDDERRRIARELHDGTVQRLTGLAMNLLLIGQAPSVADDPQVQRLIGESQTLAKESQRELRSLSYLLHPPDLEELGLASALRSWADGFGARAGLSIDVELDDPGRLDWEVETALFRIAQESLANVQRHSGSTTATIRLKATESEIRLEVEDAGLGIPAGMLARKGDGCSHPIGVGILGMRERARQLGGSLQILSNHGGTTVRVVLPREVPR